MDHHIVADIDTHMADAGGIIGSGEKHQIARLDVGRGYGRTDIAKSLRAQPAHIPTGMIDDPTDEARTVKRGGGAAAAPNVGVAEIFFRFLDDGGKYLIVQCLRGNVVVGIAALHILPDVA